MAETFEQLLARVKASAFIAGDIPMAREVKMGKGKTFEFKTKSASALAKYDWDGWLSGKLVMIEQSVGTGTDAKGNVTDITEKKDYDVATDQMPAKLKTAARRRYKVVQISRYDADDNLLKNALIIQARDMNDDEKKAENIRRAEEKARRAEADDDDDQPQPAPTPAAQSA